MNSCSLFLYICMCDVCVSMDVPPPHVCAHMCGDQESTRSIFLFILHVIFKTRSPTEPGAWLLSRLAGQQAPGSTCFCPHMLRLQPCLTLSNFFTWVLGDSNSRCDPCPAGTSPIESTPQPLIHVFETESCSITRLASHMWPSSVNL